MVQIQYASDLHINDWPKGTPFEFFLVPSAPILILAGDICSAWDPLYAPFIAWASQHWKLVLLITGNHEYFCDAEPVKTIDETDQYIAALVKQFPNVVFLQNGASYRLPGTRIRFVGATLWSAICPTIWDEIVGNKGDYKAIYNVSGLQRRTAVPADMCALHALHKAHLRSALLPQQAGEILVVITHHMPTKLLLEDEYKTEAWNSCYASDDDDLFFANIKVWICGHGHRSTRLQIPNGPLLLMNARGYNREKEMTRTTDVYNPTQIFNI